MTLFRKKDLFLYGILLLIILVSSFALLPRKTDAPVTAVVRSQGTVVREINLERAQDEIIQIHSATVEVSKGKIRFVSSGCPDQICTKTGWLSSPGASAVCVPNQVSITLSKANDDTILSY